MLRTIVSLLSLQSQAATAQQHEYCVGFHLALDYGVASIAFANGTFVDVAKIEGGQRFRQWMRSLNATDYGHMMLHEGEKHTIAESSTSQSVVKVQGLRDRLPPWLGGPPRSSPESLPLLKGLQAATESYLEQPLSNAAFALPFRVSDELRETIFYTSTSTSFEMVHAPQRVAGIHAARALRLGCGECGPQIGYPEQMILTVEFSRASITAFLVWEACGVFDISRSLHSTTLGMEQLSRDPETGTNQLTSALRDLVHLPLADGGLGSELKYVSSLVLLGESTQEAIFNNALRTVLGEQFDRLLIVTENERLAVPDPLFLAARGIAADCLSRLNYVEVGQP